MIPIGETKDGRADMTNFEMDLFDTRVSNYKGESEECCKNSIIKPACLPISILAALIIMTLIIPMFNEDFGPGSIDAGMSTPKKYERLGICKDQCNIRLVESIPTGMVFPHRPSVQHMSTYQAWSQLMRLAEKNVDLAALYWDLRDDANYSTSWQGRETFNKLEKTARRGVKIRIAQNSPGNGLGVEDAEQLKREGLAEIQTLNFTKMFGSGVLHTKLWVIDQTHLYLGSANMDWRSLTEVKELGVLITNCSCLAWELSKIFAIYWRIGAEGGHIPSVWPIYLRTKFNAKNPLKLNFGSEPVRTFISNSPSQFNPKGREHDLSAIIYCMEQAEIFIRFSVMDYLPATVYEKGHNNFFWPPIDDAIRAAAFRGVRIEFMVSKWRHSKPQISYYLRSLLAINGALPYHNSTGTRVRGRINIKYFEIPVDPKDPSLIYARVNHNKFMVTDKAAYIGTSNWSGDYFIHTAGVGLVIEREVSTQHSIVDQVNEVFQRDWTSQYNHPIN